MKALFELGQVCETSGIRELRETLPLDLPQYLRRHASGDFGDQDEPDHELSRSAVHSGGRIVSIYDIEPGVKIYIITEADRDRTTILLPTEY